MRENTQYVSEQMLISSHISTGLNHLHRNNAIRHNARKRWRYIEVVLYI